MSKINDVIKAAKDIATGNFADLPLSDKRYLICQKCPNFKPATYTCSICGCFMPAKVKLQNSNCPDSPPKW